MSNPRLLTLVPALFMLAGCPLDPVPGPSPEPTPAPPVVEADAPELVSITPSNGELNVAVVPTIELEMTETMGTTAGDSLSLEGPDGPVDVETWVEGPFLVMQPTAPLEGESEYTIVLSTEARSSDGVPLEAAVQSIFVTEDIAPPVLLGTAPPQGAFDVDIDTTITFSFSEDIDPDSLQPGSLVVRPLQRVDGINYGAGDGLAGSLVVEGTDVLWTPARGRLQEFETGYEVTLTDARDRAGNRVSATLAFETEMVDTASWYRIHNAQFHDVLDTFADTYGGHLGDPSMETSGSYWYFTEEGDTHTLRNGYAGESLYLEGGGENGRATMTGGGYFTGQHWTLRHAGDRENSTTNQSPGMFNLTNAHLGEGFSLGIPPVSGNGPYEVGLEPVGWLDQAWYLTNEGLR